MKTRKYSPNIKEYILWIFYAGYACFCTSYLLNLMTGRKIFSQSALSIPLFILLLFLLPYPYKRWKDILDDKTRKRRIRYVLFFSFLLGLSFWLGYQMRIFGMTYVGIYGKIFILLFSFGVGIALAPAVDYWFALLDSLHHSTAVSANSFSSKVNSYLFPASWAIIFLCWIPVFLAYYPAIMAYDFLTQCQEAYQGFSHFNTHHPLIHTALIRLFLSIGKMLGSYEKGMALFSLSQMLILSAVLAYSCVMIARLTGKKAAVAATVVFYALFPIHPILAISTTKDVLFAAFFLLFLLLLLEYRSLEKGKKRICLAAALIIDGILMIMFRNNAVYAFAVFAVFYILLAGKKRLQAAILCAVIIAGGQGVKWSMQHAMGAESGSRVEMCSVFIQQFARVAASHKEDLCIEDATALGKYIPEEYWSNYNPALADSVKLFVGLFSFENWEEDMPGMLVDWARIGFRYPDEYVDAFLALTSGYWFLDDVSHAEVLGYGEDIHKGVLYTDNSSVSEVFDGVETHSYLPRLKNIYQKLINGNSYYSLPVLSNLFKPAFYCWLLLLVMISLSYLREAHRQIFCLLPFLYLLTLYLGPVVHLRYAYPIVVTIPFLLAWLFGSSFRVSTAES